MGDNAFPMPRRLCYEQRSLYDELPDVNERLMTAAGYRVEWERLDPAPRPDLLALATAGFSDDDRYRYTLCRVWNPMWPPVVFLMLNPSTATAFKVDPTVGRCIDFARRWLFGGVLVRNLFAHRATDPRHMRAAADPVGPLNDAAIAAVAHLTTVAAWGAHGTHAARAARVAAMYPPGRLYCLGTTKGGQPRHPLYVAADTVPAAYAPPEG